MIFTAATRARKRTMARIRRMMMVGGSIRRKGERGLMVEVKVMVFGW